jgi:hypothetical protein
MEQSLIERLERLEKQNRRFKQAGFVLVLILVAFGTMAQQPPLNTEVKAQKFSLHDSSGKTRGMFFTREGQSILILSDRNGEPRLTLTVGADGSPAVGLFEPGDKIRAELPLTNNGPRFVLYSKDEKEQVLLNMGKNGQPQLGFLDKNKLPRVVIGAAGDQWVVGTYGPKGELTGGLGEKK